MFQQILVPTDFSDASKRALVAAKAFSHSFQGHLHLVHIDEERALGMHSSDDLIHFMTEVDRRRTAWMETLGAELEAAGHTVTLARLEGIASTKILRYVEDHQISLVVMGAVGHSHLRDLLLGSTGDAVLQHAPCPVLTVGARVDLRCDWTISRILFPTDFSRASVAGAQLVGRLARALKTEVELLHVLKAPSWIPAMPGEPLSVHPNAFAAAETRAIGDLQTLSEREALQDLHVNWGATLAADAAEGIAETALSTHSDLVVIPRHGHGALRSILFGRVVRQVVKRSTVPVLSFRPR